MAVERLEAFPRLRIPDLDGAVVRRRRDMIVVVREGDRPDRAAMALERLEAAAPTISHIRLGDNPFGLFLLEQLSRQAASWTEYEC